MEGVELYKDRTLAVDSILDYHPEFNPSSDPRFSREEQEAFTTVFQPDWDKFQDDYREAYAHFKAKEPELFSLAHRAFEKWLRLYGIDPAGL